MAYQSRRPRRRSKCPVYTRLMRSSNNHPNKCRSCHGCTIDNKCNTFSQWTDVIWAGIVECSQNRLKRKRRAVSETQAYDKPSTTLKPALRDEHIHERARLQTCSISSGSFLGFSPVPSPESPGPQCEYLAAMALVWDSNNKAGASETCVFDNIVIPRIDGSNCLRGFSDTPILAEALYINGTSKTHKELMEALG